MLSIYLSKLDIVIIFLSLGLTCCAAFFSLWYRRRCSNNEGSEIIEYLLMGRQLTLPLFIASLSIGWYGNILGVTQIAFEHGIYNFITQGLFWYIGYILFAIFLVKKIRMFNVATLPELVLHMFGTKAAKFTANFVFFKSIPITYSISIGILLNVFYGIPLSYGICIGVTFVSLYTYLGGFRGIIVTDAIQTVFLLIGIFSVVICSYFKFGGWQFLAGNLPASHFSTHGSHPSYLLFVWLCIACASTLISPTFYQRCLAAKNNRVAVAGIFTSIAIWIFIDSLTTLGGMYAKAILPNAKSQIAYLQYSLQILPTGIKGIFVAGLIASILSTLDAKLLVSSSVVFYDVKWFAKYSFWVRRIIASVICAVITITISIAFKGRLEFAWLTIRGLFTSCLLLPIMVGFIFPKMISDKQFITASSIGCVCFLSWNYIFHDIKYICFFIGLIATAISIAVSVYINERLSSTHSST